jgi:predicted transcriptional regulator
VYTVLVRNITLSADEDLIEKARSVARAQRRSLNDAFREWLEQYTTTDGEAAAARFDELMKELRHVNAGRHFTRDELNER